MFNLTAINIYHITHRNNLSTICREGHLWSDKIVRQRALSLQSIGMSTIKERRLTKIAVDCHPNSYVGEYVPFYFCPRSIMLYLLYKKNHPDIHYQGSQQDIIHLQTNVQEVLNWAQQNTTPWAFSDTNAGAKHAKFSKVAQDLALLHWDDIAKRNWANPKVKAAKQAEFLVFKAFPFHLIKTIGIADKRIKPFVTQCLQDTPYQPRISIEPAWYY